MTKFLIAGDIHWRGTNPRGRTDDYLQALGAKLDEIAGLCQEHDAQLIIPGDLFDSPGVGWWVTGQLVNKLRTIQEVSEQPVLTIPGNHDIFGSNPDSIFRTPYGLLEFTDTIRNVARSRMRRRHEGASETVQISGHGYDANTDTDTPEGRAQFMAPEPKDDSVAKIHLVHSNLLLQAPGFDMPHTLINDVKTNADVIIAGHYHPGLGSGRFVYTRNDGVLFINPGALARTSASASDMERPVQVALLTIMRVENKLWFGVQTVPLKSVLPGPEVLSRQHLDDAQERAGRIQDFLELLAEEGQSRFLEMSEIIEDIVERDRLPKEIKAEALRRLSLAQEVLGR